MHKRFSLFLHFSTFYTTQGSYSKLSEEVADFLYPSISLLEVLLYSANPTFVSQVGFLVHMCNQQTYK